MVYLTCAFFGLGGRGVIKAWTELAARVPLHMPTSDLTSLVPPQFSQWLQVRKVGTIYFLFVTPISLRSVLMISLYRERFYVLSAKFSSLYQGSVPYISL